MPHPYDEPPSGYEPRRPRYWRILAILVGALAMGFLGVYIADMVVRSDNSDRNTSIDGHDVGGLYEEEIRGEVQKLSTEYANRSLPLLTPAGTVAATVGQLGFSLDVEANVSAALAAPGKIEEALNRRVAGCAREPVPRDPQIGVSSGPLLALYRVSDDMAWRSGSPSLALAAKTPPPGDVSFLIFVPELDDGAGASDATYSTLGSARSASWAGGPR